MKKATDQNQWLSHYWWAHLDSNQGPKDYEQLKEIKTYINQQVTIGLQQCGSKCGSKFLHFSQAVDCESAVKWSKLW